MCVGGGRRAGCIFKDFGVPNHVSQVLNVFPPNMFPIAPHFYLICFAQSCPLFIYVGGPKGDALYIKTCKI